MARHGLSSWKRPSQAERLSPLCNLNANDLQEQVVAAVIVFWPAAFLVSGDDAQTAELARLKGEFAAIQQISIQKNCGTRFEARQLPPR
jgi:hypothetical protein